jgi:peroxiredoxin
VNLWRHGSVASGKHLIDRIGVFPNIEGILPEFEGGGNGSKLIRISMAIEAGIVVNMFACTDGFIVSVI